METEERYTPQPEKKGKGGFVKMAAASFTGVLAGGTMMFYMAPALLDTNTTATGTKSSNTANEITVQPASTASSSENDLMSAIDSVNEAVVGVVNLQQQEQFNPFGSQSMAATDEDTEETEAGTGSGVIFKKGEDVSYVVTNNHVVEGADTVELALAGGERIDAEVVGTDALTDLAVLKISSDHVTEVADFGDSSALKLGQQVAAIGNPLGLDLSSSVTEGIVSGIDRTVPVSTSAGEWEANVIQTDAAINPGNSGGALINSAGQVIGINSMKIAEEGVEGLGFAIPSEDAVPVIQELMEDGKVDRPYLGVGLEDVSALSREVTENQLNLPTSVTKGTVVSQVEMGSSAAKAGFEVGDVIVKINDTKVAGTSEFRKYLYNKANIGDKVNVTIYRDGKEQTISMTLSTQSE
ncbi:trypsin-like peptidase domain-containing protein [Domibacillus sp. DTU_2020_1001157_1_SI_ALB_TIR_016]|uniref:S1C family serine protease n=1 Tax=Domibacillus sp. DTU_2020_1001157_1_SI_ALB_TIR_016 TaxID=3077789 RepID=UPI0028EDF6BC|nr:trypsin-like peptidase domain-containing protein [Domibacillus sp. DTU_2020_1001157_1_SI_ALB_TIR_016]WNS81461.1 trypsin-like peptidase domain-containing protein [Domibacillus sp. DTU_2020_1001157_1_SI_ALB_TIR_016]